MRLVGTSFLKRGEFAPDRGPCIRTRHRVKTQELIMSINKVATAAVALALPLAAVAAPVSATAHGKAAKPHHSKPHKRNHGAKSRTVSFTARVVRATAGGLVVRTASGRTLSFSAGQIKHRALPKHHGRTHRKGLAHDLNLQVSGGNVVLNILGLAPGAVVQITETINPDNTITVTITLPPAPAQQTEQSAAGVVTDLESDTFTVETGDGSDLRLHMDASSLSQAGLNPCETVDVTYHQDGGLLVADSVTATGSSTAGDCAPSDDASGSITAISSDSVTVATDQGSVTVSVDPSSGLTDGFQVGDVVDVTYSQATDGSLVASDISYLEDDTSGQVTSVTSSASGGSVTITDDNTGSSETFSANPDGVDVHGQAFNGVQPGDQIELTYHTSAGQLVADTVSEQ